jgi:hypothetical protein
MTDASETNPNKAEVTTAPGNKETEAFVVAQNTVGDGHTSDFAGARIIPKPN